MLSVQQLLNICMIWERFTKKKNGFHISYKKMPFQLNVCISLIARQKKEEFFYIELLLWMKNGFILIIPNKKNYGLIQVNQSTNVHFKVQYSRFKSIAVYLGSRYCVLWTVKFERNCWSLLTTNEANIRPKIFQLWINDAK